MSTSKTVIITGGNSGLGYHSATALAKERDWHIVIASRDQTRVQDAVEQLKHETGHDAITPLIVDLGSFKSVRLACGTFTEMALPPLHAILCNAGVSLRKNRQTSEGIDMIFGVNHLGHYLLTHLLSNQLKEPGRVIFVSSGTHIPEHKLARRFGVPIPNYTNAKNLAYPDDAPKVDRIDNPIQRYSTSKLCNVLCAYEFARQFEAAGKEISVFGLDPGLMPGTNLVREIPAFLLNGLVVPLLSLMERRVDGIRFPEQSGKDMARLILDESVAGKTALYFDGHAETRSSDDSYDLAKAKDLWNTSRELCGLEKEETILPLQI